MLDESIVKIIVALITLIGIIVPVLIVNRGKKVINNKDPIEAITHNQSQTEVFQIELSRNTIRDEAEKIRNTLRDEFEETRSEVKKISKALKDS